jgi:predicted porin
MKGKVVLGIALLATATQSQAQTATSVTLYGIIDTTIRYSNNNAGDKNLAELTDGYFNGSRWGIRGNEDLGGGLTALFVLESGFDPSTGVSSQGTSTANYGQQSTGGQGRLFGRTAIVGLEKDKIGRLTLGRQFTTPTTPRAASSPTVIQTSILSRSSTAIPGRGRTTWPSTSASGDRCRLARTTPLGKCQARRRAVPAMAFRSATPPARLISARSGSRPMH